MQYFVINSLSTNASRGAAVLLFLIGLLSQTQVSLGGKLGISEFVMVLFAPFAFFKNLSLLRRDGVLLYFWLILLWLGGAIFVDLYRSNYILFMLKGIAVPITVFANSICVYVLLRNNFSNLRWFLLGVAISGVISIFIFQRGGAGDVAAEFGMEAGMEKVVSYKLFWVFQLTTWLTLPIVMNYLKCPKWYMIIVVIFMALFNLYSGGRSMFLSAALTLLMIVLAGKSRQSIALIKRHVGLMLVLILILGVVVKFGYDYAARHRYLSEAEQAKHEKQTAQGSGFLNLLMAGRGDTFIGLFAALDKPILGHGSVAIDDHGYILDFLRKYGTERDYQMVRTARDKYGVYRILAHSHIVCYWMWHGIFGLIFWLYVIYLSVKTILQRLHIYPAWYGYFAVSLPMFFWDVIFSPFGKRVEYSALFVTFLLVANMERMQRKGLIRVSE